MKVLDCLNFVDPSHTLRMQIPYANALIIYLFFFSVKVLRNEKRNQTIFANERK